MTWSSSNASERWGPARLTVRTDAARGGRWTSLRAGDREWLWTNPSVPAAARADARPGDALVDAGGVEECFPTLRGSPDHGDVWSRPWVEDGDGVATVRAGALGLRRRMRLVDGGALRVDYDVTGSPGARVLHAIHMLLDLSPDARLLLPAGARVVVLDRPTPGRSVTTTWPDGDGARLDRLVPDDGTARCAVVAADAVDAVDGPDRLGLRWGAGPPAGADETPPVSLVVWRNLHGWPEHAPYRSVGVEPLLGAAIDRDLAAPEQTAVLGHGGRLAWRLEIRASRLRPTVRAVGVSRT